MNFGTQLCQRDALKGFPALLTQCVEEQAEIQIEKLKLGGVAHI